MYDADQQLTVGDGRARQGHGEHLRRQRSAQLQAEPGRRAHRLRLERARQGRRADRTERSEANVRLRRVRPDRTAHTDTAGRTTRYRYDAAGRLVALVDRAGRTTSYAYDKDGNLTEVAYADDTVTAAWDPLGRQVSVRDADTLVERTFNDANDLASERTRGANGVSLPDVTLSYTTDANGQRTGLAGPGGSIEYAYDNRLRLTSVRDPAGETFTLGVRRHRPARRALTRPNGVNDTLALHRRHPERRASPASGVTSSTRPTTRWTASAGVPR